MYRQIRVYVVETVVKEGTAPESEEEREFSHLSYTSLVAALLSTIFFPHKTNDKTQLFIFLLFFTLLIFTICNFPLHFIIHNIYIYIYIYILLIFPLYMGEKKSQHNPPYVFLSFLKSLPTHIKVRILNCQTHYKTPTN
ncbi:hypothetical protein, unlikely [Trypanosoma brucei brucei TREU927]|uniref:Uncharacterized protein n=1 Tax=Trypanosoma brucei brucei (strain 927/4 GUTat10.1) TaxID=185431 RepID=Q38E48_TRYB2|nr:hypothetical protein, unlikely [Trypanosoma brucei brucei TREU927]EAN76922.1 hypothetical protein, unlikely [Trypanosoma brucei brucei TREU927]